MAPQRVEKPVLDRAVVVTAALAILNDVGLEGLSLRRLATVLGVKAPALYWHFKDKQELLDEVATAMLGELVSQERLPDADRPWTDWFTELGRGLRQMLLHYRDGARVFTSTYLSDARLFAPMELFLRRLTESGFPLRAAVRGASTVYSYTIGFTLEEQAVRPWGVPADDEDLIRRAERIGASRYQLAIDAGENVFTAFDERYEHGLQLIIAGIAHSVVSDIEPAVDADADSGEIKPVIDIEPAG